MQFAHTSNVSFPLETTLGMYLSPPLGIIYKIAYFCLKITLQQLISFNLEFFYLFLVTGVEIRVHGRKDYIDSLENATNKIVSSLKIIQEFWNVPYPLPKLDCLALPSYQATRPADNWGVILFK